MSQSHRWSQGYGRSLRRRFPERAGLSPWASLELLHQFGSARFPSEWLEITDLAGRQLAEIGRDSERRTPEHKSGICEFELPARPPALQRSASSGRSF